MKDSGKKLIGLAIVGVFLAGCADRIVTSDDYVTPDYRRPSVEHRVPLSGAINVPLDEPITIWFDKLMNDESIEHKLQIWRDIPANRMQAVAAGESGVFAGKINGGIFRNTNNDLTWEWVSHERPEFNAIKLATAGSHLFAATTSAVYRSGDGGASFEDRSGGLPPIEILDLAVAKDNADLLYITTASNGIFRSRDGGGSWVNTSAGLRAGRPVTAIAINPSDPDFLLATTDVDFLYRSTDGGESWVRVRQGIRDRDLRSVAFSASEPGVAYTMGEAGAVYRSSDMAQTWVETALLVDEEGLALAVHPSDANVAAAGTTGGVYLTTDGGDSWSSLSGRDAEGSSISVAFAYDVVFRGNALFVATEEGVFLMEGSSVLTLVDDVSLDNLLINGSMQFETWRDTLEVIALRDYLDPSSADTAIISPYVSERALSGWIAGGRRGPPPVEADPVATKVTVHPNTPYAANAHFRILIPGTFEEDTQTIRGERGVEDVLGNSMEVDFLSSFRTRAN